MYEVDGVRVQSERETKAKKTIVQSVSGVKDISRANGDNLLALHCTIDIDVRHPTSPTYNREFIIPSLPQGDHSILCTPRPAILCSLPSRPGGGGAG